MTSFYTQFKVDGRLRTRHLGKEASKGGRHYFMFQGERFETWQEWKEYLETSDVRIINTHEQPVEIDELIALVEASAIEVGRKYYMDFMGVEYDPDTGTVPDNMTMKTDESTWLDPEGYLFYSGMFF